MKLDFIIDDYAVEYSDTEISYTNLKTDKTETISKAKFELVLAKSSPMQLFFNGIPVNLMRQIQMKVFEEMQKKQENTQDVQGEKVVKMSDEIYRKIY